MKFIEYLNEGFNYNKILTPKTKKIITDSVKAAIYDGHDHVNIDTDKIIGLFTDNLSPKEYKQFNTDKAEDFLIDYANKMFKKENKTRK